MRKFSAETEVRHLRRDLKRAREGALTLQQDLNTYRVRATKAEQEVAEWKRRFDALLARTPEVPDAAR